MFLKFNRLFLLIKKCLLKFKNRILNVCLHIKWYQKITMNLLVKNFKKQFYFLIKKYNSQESMYKFYDNYFVEI